MNGCSEFAVTLHKEPNTVDSKRTPNSHLFWHFVSKAAVVNGINFADGHNVLR